MGRLMAVKRDAKVSGHYDGGKRARHRSVWSSGWSERSTAFSTRICADELRGSLLVAIGDHSTTILKILNVAERARGPTNASRNFNAFRRPVPGSLASHGAIREGSAGDVGMAEI